jgi:hypothetical protein
MLLWARQARGQNAQDHDHDDHDHDHGLHFAHPLIVESPSPDTKLRLDYFDRKFPGGAITERAIRLEGEYAFTRSVSLEFNLPFVRRSESSNSVAGIGSTELALKLATFAFDESGLLVGGGIETELPSGDDNKGIGSNHLIGVSPYVDFGYMHHSLEIVAFAAVETSVHRRSGEEAERSLNGSASALYHLRPRLETLLELESSAPLTGGDRALGVGVAPGLKYHPLISPKTVVGVSVHLPVTKAREIDREIVVSALYHF